jgi:hypothetical protein
MSILCLPLKAGNLITAGPWVSVTGYPTALEVPFEASRPMNTMSWAGCRVENNNLDWDSDIHSSVCSISQRSVVLRSQTLILRVVSDCFGSNVWGHRRLKYITHISSLFWPNHATEIPRREISRHCSLRTDAS